MIFKRIFYIIFSITMIVHAGMVFGRLHSEVGIDWTMRYNEAQCVRMGVNPFDVYTEKVKLLDYVAYNPTSAGRKSVHTYTPWEYTLALPLTVFSLETASSVMWFINLAAAIFIFILGFRAGLRLHGEKLQALFVGSAGLALGGALYYVLHVQNYGLIISAFILLMCRALQKKQRILAGVCWAIIMIKPQIGLLLAIPLLMSGQILTCAVAAGICITASLVPAILCKTSPIEMILQIYKSGTPYVIDRLALFPKPIFAFLQTHIETDGTILLSMLIGASICAVVSWRVRRNPDWLVRIAPALVCIPFWTYSHFQDRCIWAGVFILLASHFCAASSRWQKLWTLLVLLTCIGAISMLWWGYQFHAGKAIFCWIFQKPLGMTIWLHFIKISCILFPIFALLWLWLKKNVPFCSVPNSRFF